MIEQNQSSAGVSRRKLLMGAGAAAGATTLLGAKPAAAAAAERPSRAEARVKRATALPKPIPGGLETGTEFPGFIHFMLPGPEGATTQVFELPAMGLDVEASTITDFDGAIAMAVLTGTAQASDGESYPVEFDVRVMEGRYIAEDGVTRNGAFAFV